MSRTPNYFDIMNLDAQTWIVESRKRMMVEALKGQVSRVLRKRRLPEKVIILVCVTVKEEKCEMYGQCFGHKDRDGMRDQARQRNVRGGIHRGYKSVVIVLESINNKDREVQE